MILKNLGTVLLIVFRFCRKARSPRMIDTVKFKIPLTPIIMTSITNKAPLTINSPLYGMKLFTTLTVPPLNQTMTVFKDYNVIKTRKIKDPHPSMYFYVEGSLPKLEYGENIHLLYPKSLPSLLKRIEVALLEQFGGVPSWETWEVQRFDIPYAYKFDSNDEAVRVLDFLKTLEYKDKTKHIYKTSLYFGGRAYSVKFYLKEPEFRKEEYRKLVKDGSKKIADKLLEVCKGILRFEIRINKAHFITLFGKKNIFANDLVALDTNWYNKLLQNSLHELMHNINYASITDELALNNFLNAYGKQKGSRLFYFWKTFYINENHIKKLLKKHVGSSTILRNFKDIENAGVGIPQINNKIPFDLSIPSKYVINSETAPVAQATEQHNE